MPAPSICGVVAYRRPKRMGSTPMCAVWSVVGPAIAVVMLPGVEGASAAVRVQGDPCSQEPQVAACTRRGGAAACASWPWPRVCNAGAPCRWCGRATPQLLCDGGARVRTMRRRHCGGCGGHGGPVRGMCAANVGGAGSLVARVHASWSWGDERRASAGPQRGTRIGPLRSCGRPAPLVAPTRLAGCRATRNTTHAGADAFLVVWSCVRASPPRSYIRASPRPGRALPPCGRG